MNGWLLEGFVSAAAFQFDEKSEHIKDGHMAQSICWEDDESVVSTMFQQKKDDEFQFKVGIARVPRESIDHINRLMPIRELISYDREPLDDNLHHGNLLVNTKSSNTQRKLVSIQIAMHVSELIPRDRTQMIFS